MSEEQMNSYRLTSMEEPGDERMAQIMREVAGEAVLKAANYYIDLREKCLIERKSHIFEERNK